MAQFVNIFDVDLQKATKPVPLKQIIGEGDVNANRIGAVVTNDGASVSLGGSCVGKVVRADGATVQLTGTISGNTAYVVLDQQCCAIEGPIQVAVCWVSSSNVTTLVIAYGTVVSTQTGNAIQPSTPIPDLTELLAQIDAMEQATAAANAAASKSVRYDTTQSLTEAQKATAIGNISAASASDLNYLQGAFSNYGISGIQFPNNLVNPYDFVDNAYVLASAGTISTGQSGYFCTGFIPVTAGTVYIANTGRSYAWYNSSKEYLSGDSGTGIQGGIAAPTNAAYIRFTVNKSSDGINTPFLLYFASSDNYHYTADIPGLDIPGSDLRIVGKQFPNNLVSPSECVDNAYITVGNGSVSLNHSGYFCTGFIPVTAGTSYKANKGRNYAWYNSSKTYISGTSGAGIQSGVTAPTNAAYIRFSVNKSTDGIDSPYLLYFTSSDNYHNVTVIPGIDLGNAQPWCYGGTINWIGDSIVDGQDFDEQVCNALNLTKLTIDGTEAQSGQTPTGGINGSTIAKAGDGTNTRNAICARYSLMPENADIIAVSAGTNDFQYAWCPIGTINDADDGTSDTTFYGALKHLCKGLIDRYPKKVIFFTTPIKRAQPFEDGNGGTYTPDNQMTTPWSKNKYGKTLMDYADIIIEVCGYYSIPVLDMYRESLLNPHLSSQQDMFDNVYTHPNATAQNIMARRVCGWLTQLGYTIT